MSSSQEKTGAKPESGNSGEGLREVLLRLTSPRYAALQEQLESLHSQIASLQVLEETLNSVEAQLTQQDETLDQRTQDIQELLEKAQAELAALTSGLADLDEALRAEISRHTEQAQVEINRLEGELSDPLKVLDRISPVLVSATDEQVRENKAAYATAVAPVIGPAIRQQIRTARQDIIDAIYPIIGQIVGKAIAEELRELTRKIDAQLRSQLDLGARLQLLAGRLRGVSEADQLLREALPYAVEHVFLIHRKTGLLLRHLAVSSEETEDADLISGMLTAIQDFMRDSFGDEDGELEEVTHGDQRILLEGGQYAFVAVVLEGVEPPGYAGFMRHTVSEINVQHETSLSAFSGDMAALPGFEAPLGALATPTGEQLLRGTQTQSLGRGQKWALAGGAVGIIILIALVIFGCIFTYRLWPLAFPGTAPTPSPTPTAAILATVTQTTAAPTALPTPLPTATSLPTLTATLEPTLTSTTEPTATNPPAPSGTPAPRLGTLTGNLNVRAEPTTDSRILGTILSGETVHLLDFQGGWYRIRWPVAGEPELEGWVWGQFAVVNNSD